MRGSGSEPAAAGFHICHLACLPPGGPLCLGWAVVALPTQLGLASPVFFLWASPASTFRPCVQHVPDGGTVIPSPMGGNVPRPDTLKGRTKSAYFPAKKKPIERPNSAGWAWMIGESVNVLQNRGNLRSFAQSFNLMTPFWWI